MNTFLKSLITLSLTINWLIAQNNFNDARLWLYIKADKNISNKLNLEVTIQNRLTENFQQYNTFAAGTELSYKLNKHFKLLSNFVYVKRRRLDGFYAPACQIQFGFNYRYKIKSFKIVYRSLVQTNQRLNSERANILLVNRNKVTINYEVNQYVELYTASEIHLPIISNNTPAISRYRWFVGGIYNLTKKSNLDVYFLFQRPNTYKNQIQNHFIYGITYSRSF